MRTKWCALMNNWMISPHNPMSAVIRPCLAVMPEFSYLTPPQMMAPMMRMLNTVEMASRVIIIICICLGLVRNGW